MDIVVGTGTPLQIERAHGEQLALAAALNGGLCRRDRRREDLVSALVAAIDPSSPADTVVRIALGKPCHAGRQADGHLETTLRFRAEDIPTEFRSGEVWKRYWTEVPSEGEPAAVR